VTRRVDGLQRKFQVIGNDALADAFRVRLVELDAKRSHWAPDILSLLLELSDQPATKIDVDKLGLVGSSPLEQPSAAKPVLKWVDIQASDVFEGEEDLWKDIDFAAESSDDSMSIASSDIFIPRIVPHSSKAPFDKYTLPNDLFVPVEDQDLIWRIQGAQNYQEVPGTHASGATIRITEIQAIREVTFMLQNLPTALFRELDGVIEVDRRFTLGDVSHETFVSLLRSLASIGTRIRRVRGFIKQPQRVPFMEMFQRQVEHSLALFDMYLSNAQGDHMKENGPLSVSAIQLLDDVRRESKFLHDMADLVLQLKPHDTNGIFKPMDLLYDLVCSKQAAGEDQEYKLAVAMFLKCFQVYLKPIQVWMERGELDPTLGTFFVMGLENANLKVLWHEWFALRRVSGALFAPKFLQGVASKIFTTGKSMIFLRRLGVSPETLLSVKSKALIYDDLFPPGDDGLLVPFSGLLENALGVLVDGRHRITSTLLRTQLEEKSGVLQCLQALEYIYLGKDLSRLAYVERRMFDLLDRGSPSWNDRFLLTDLLQQAFAGIPCLDPSRLVARSRTITSHEFERRCRSVKILNALSLEYSLPWPVANIVAKQTIGSFQRLSIFLMQIRRAKYLLEGRWFLRPYIVARDNEDAEDTFSYHVRYCLLQFLNVVYCHLTELVISCSAVAMLKKLAAAVDVDAMIAVHSAHTSSLEDQCLLSSRQSALHDAVISILDLAIRLSDLHTLRQAERQYEESTASVDSSISRRYSISRGRRKRPSTGADYSSDIDGDGPGQGAEISMLGEGNMTFLDAPYKEQLHDIKKKFDRHSAFLTAGLRAVGRVDGQDNWELLADKLEGRKESLIGPTPV
jgi:gamma-tubulin complex component 5